MSPSSFFKVFLLYKEHYMIYLITEKAQITLSGSFVNQEMFISTLSLFLSKMLVLSRVSPTPFWAGSRFMALLGIAVNPTTGACIPLAAETVFSNVYVLQNCKKLSDGPVEREREGVNEKLVLPLL
jgi:hypothetical protein